MSSKDSRHFVGMDVRQHRRVALGNMFNVSSLKKKRIFFFCAGVALFVFASIIFITQISLPFFTEVPASGGTVREGGVGSVRFINPVLAISPVDRDLTALVFAGLLRPSPSGLTLELAESYTVSSDGREYEFILRDNLVFHDGTPLTAEDVRFTIELIQQETLKSPLFASWEGIQVTLVDDRTIRFTLEEAYAPFIENLTVGILPSQTWKGTGIDEIPFSELNVEPVGAGPFSIARAKRDAGGIPRSYELQRFGQYVLGKPYLKKMIYKVFRDEESALAALRAGEIDSLSNVTPALIHEHPELRALVRTALLPRVFGVFYNPNRASLFTRAEVRETLEILTDREELIEHAMSGFASPLGGPLPGVPLERTEEPKASPYEEAESLLTRRGWTRADDGVWELETKTDSHRFSFELTTADIPELVASATYLAEKWRAFGIDVSVSVIEPSELTQSVIRPRKFGALLFGMVVGREMDLYAFWHSSQRTDPGLNIAQYTSITADKLLETARRSADKQKRAEALEAFSKEIQAEHASLFLYQPQFLYLAPAHIRNMTLENLSHASDRFGSIHLWHTKTTRVFGP